MSNKLFVGGLASETTDESLRAAFEPFGELTEARVILDRETRRSRGFGFVRFATPDQARSAMEQMTGAMLDGRSLRIDLAEDRRGPPGPRGGPGGGPPRGGPGGGPRGPGGRPPGPAPVVARRGGGAPGGPPRGGPPRNEVWTPGPAPEEEEAGWDDARIRRTERKQKPKRPVEDAAPRPTRAAPQRQRRSSGQSWRDWAVDDEEDDF